MKEYLKLMKHIMAKGNDKEDRTGTGTKSVFGYQFRINLAKGFPLLTTKRMYVKGIIHELLWFLNGDTNIKYLVDNNVNIWNGDAYREYTKAGGELTLNEFVEKIKKDKLFAQLFGALGPVYGHQWRSWTTPEINELDKDESFQDVRQKTIDQIAWVINEIKTNPDGRRHLVSAWNPADLNKMALPPCHYAFQFYVSNGKLSCMFQMRSVDTFLGLPFNIASYAFLTHMVAHVCGLEVGELIFSGADVHIYNNHFDQVEEQLTRTPKKLPKLIIEDRGQGINDFKITDFFIDGYDPYPTIKGELST
jgi:thymidylate synthase